MNGRNLHPGIPGGVPVIGASGPVKDRMGRELKPGDAVVVDMPVLKEKQIVYQVAGIEPVVGPGVPPGLMRVRLVTAPVIIHTQGGAISQELIRVAEAAEVKGPQPMDQEKQAEASAETPAAADAPAGPVALD